MDPDIFIQILVLLLLVLANAFFAMSEIAIISLNDNKLKALAEEGDKKAKKVLKLTEDVTGFLSTIQIGVTLAGFLASASAAATFAEPLADWTAKTIFKMPQASEFLQTVAMVLVTILISYVTLVLGELAPKRIAMKKSEKVAFRSVGILLFINAIMKPFVKVLSFSTNVVLRLFGIDPNEQDEEVTEEEIRLMVDAGEENGVLEESQKEMINNIFEFDDAVVAEVMTHRTDIEAVEITDSIEDVVKIAVEEGFSRIPVYEDELDNIVGILYIKDLLPYVGKAVPQGKKISKLMREVNFVPESKKCGDLFEEMTEKHIHMVVVSDEYGGVAGVVTIEDLIESIVGNIQDEYDMEEEEAVQLNETTFELDGTADIEEVEETLEITFPEGEYETIGGFIMSEIGHIPTEDEEAVVEFSGYRLTVKEVDERRIERVLAERLPKAETEEEEENSKRKKKDK